MVAPRRRITDRKESDMAFRLGAWERERPKEGKTKRARSPSKEKSGNDDINR
jgi:hypothetical protein